MTSTVDLPSLASIWVARWLKYGGGLIANPDVAHLSVSMSMERWRWKRGPHEQRLWHDGWMVGRWRELSDLIDLVPGLREAVVDHVIAHGSPYGPTSRCMACYGEHVERHREQLAGA